MSQLTLEFPKFKNGNGARHGRPDERNLAADLKRWLARGVSAAMLRVARKLMRK